MGATPDELRRDADTTRAHLAHTADRLADKVSPPRVARRRAAAARQGLANAKDRIMGTAGSAPAKAASTGRSVRDTTEEFGRGSPLAAGLTAFGAGLVAGALFPPTGPETRAGQQIREHAEEWVEPVKETGRASVQHVAEDLREPAKEAAAAVKDTARGAAADTQQEARRATGEAAREVKDEVKDTSRRGQKP